MTKKELKEYFVDEAEYSESRVNRMTDEELFDAYLCYNGIIGYTWDIIDVVKHLKFE